MVEASYKYGGISSFVSKSIAKITEFVEVNNLL